MSTQFGDGKRTLSTGDLVISVSEIFDRLQTKVDPNTLEQLLRDILAGRINQVRPGELITAELINQILAELESLHVRVTKLEAGSTVPTGPAVVINSLQPSGPVPMQSELRILGKNFGVPSANVVTIDGVPVRDFKAGSGDMLLIIDVPLVAGVTEAGKTVALTVSGELGFAQTTLVIVPAVATTPGGSLFPTLSKSPTDAQLLAGQSYTFIFAVQAITNMDESFTLTPTVSTGWPVAIVGEGDTPITPEIRIPKSDPPNGTTRDVRVRVSIPQGTAVRTTGQLRLAVVSKRNPTGLQKTSGGDTISVGEPPPPPQKIIVSYNTVVSPPGASPARRDENNIVAIPQADTKYRVDFSVLIAEPGTSTFNITLTPPGAGWTATIQGAPTINTTGTSLNRLVGVSLTAQAGAPAANLVLILTKSDDPTFFGQFSQRIRFGT